jgi:hypothetical protein
MNEKSIIVVFGGLVVVIVVISLVVVSLLIPSLIPPAPPPNREEMVKFSFSLGGGYPDQGGLSLARDKEDHIIVTGRAGGTYPLLHASDDTFAGESEGYVAKYTADGSLVWGTFLGGKYQEAVSDVAVDAANNIIVMGETTSSDLPGLDILNSTYNGKIDVFVTKYTSSGSLLWSIYVGNTENDYGSGVAVDSQDNIIVGGFNYNLGKIFLIKFSANGTLVWSTYVGGTDDDIGRGVAVDSQDNIVLVGYTSSSDFPIVNANASLPCSSGGFIMKFAPNGTLVWSTIVGPDCGAKVDDVAIDSQDDMVIVGSYRSIVFVTKCYTNQSLAWEVSLGERYMYSRLSVSLDSQDNVLLAGATDDPTFPTVNAYDSTFASSTDARYPTIDAFVVKLTSLGTLTWSTFLGGGGWDEGNAVIADTQDNIIVTGSTAGGRDFPTTRGDEGSGLFFTCFFKPEEFSTYAEEK